LPQICLNFLDFFHRLGDKEILWEKRNFGDCKRIFEQAVVEALERSLLSAGLDFRACERKGGTADNTSRNEIRVAHTTQNSHWSKSIRLSIKSDM
jgi:hypothetical protein